jgi:hypothetical protein
MNCTKRSRAPAIRSGITCSRSFLSRDITRQDLRELVHLGLANARGSYTGLLTLFGIESTDYQRFLNFLAAYDCVVDFRLFGDNGGRSKTSGPS